MASSIASTCQLLMDSRAGRLDLLDFWRQVVQIICLVRWQLNLRRVIKIKVFLGTVIRKVRSIDAHAQEKRLVVLLFQLFDGPVDAIVSAISSCTCLGWLPIRASKKMTRVYEDIMRRSASSLARSIADGELSSVDVIDGAHPVHRRGRSDVECRRRSAVRSGTHRCPCS